VTRDIAVSVRGRSPLLMHRYGGEQPSAAKAPRGKKTQEHIDAQRRKKWMEAAYFAGDTFHVPPENLEAMLSEAARGIRKGNDFKRAVVVVDDFIPLTVYSGPDDSKGRILKGRLEDFYVPEYTDVRGVVIQKSRVDACRPIFRHWGLSFTIRYDTEALQESDVKTALSRGCLGDFRPRFGRFAVTSFEAIKGAAA
jgi:hypothetical protein